VIVEQELADQLGRPVELVTERALSRHVRPHVQTGQVLCMKRDDVYLRRTPDAIHQTEEYTEDVDRAAFDEYAML
jgi:hypothetical protein